MEKANISIEELRSRIQSGECSDPIVFLESISRGEDPRKTSLIYDLVNDINDFSDGFPCKSDWEELTKLVNRHYKYEKVSVGDSLSAAKTLAEYLHAKKKQIDINQSDKSVDSSSQPLTEEEIILFKETFNDEF